MDLGESFDKLKNEMFVNYRGLLLERCAYGGYKISGKWYQSLEEIDKELDRRVKIINDSIKK